MSKNAHIVAVPAELFEGRKNGLIDLELHSSDLVLIERQASQDNFNYRKVIPITVFISHSMGGTNDIDVWGFSRGDDHAHENLKNAITVSVGGHWEAKDLFYVDDGSIDIHQSMSKATRREVDEEVIIKDTTTGNIITGSEVSYLQSPTVIAADDTSTDRQYAAVISFAWLPNTCTVEGSLDENELHNARRYTRDELRSPEVNAETWTLKICDILDYIQASAPTCRNPKTK